VVVGCGARISVGQARHGAAAIVRGSHVSRLGQSGLACMGGVHGAVGACRSQLMGHVGASSGISS
jgi:hypothetical protein